jgi:ribosomal protein S27AE
MLNVPRGVEWIEQCAVHSQLEHRHTGDVDSACYDLRNDLCVVEKVQGHGLTRMSDDNPLALDVEKRTTRGRLCPRCGGKIIPSNRAVYQSGADPAGSFPVWQCERCGYEEVAERKKPAGKARH